MRIASSVLTGWLDTVDTLVSVGRRGRDGPVEEGGPWARCGSGDAGVGLVRMSTNALFRGLGIVRMSTNALFRGLGIVRMSTIALFRRGANDGDSDSGTHRTSDRLMSTGRAVIPWRLKSSTSTLG